MSRADSSVPRSIDREDWNFFFFLSGSQRISKGNFYMDRYNMFSSLDDFFFWKFFYTLNKILYIYNRDREFRVIDDSLI